MFFFGKSAPELLLIISVILLTLTGRVTAHERIPKPVKVTVMEEHDVILPCSLSTEESIEFKVFDWRKDGQKEVFLYDAGIHYNNGQDGQDKQFKGRVSHFPDQLKNGNASIKIQNTKVADSGNYTCDFPRLQPSQTFHIELVVIVAPEPHIEILDATKDWSLLQCEVQGASPKPKVEWKDRAGNILPAEEPQVSYRGERYNITLLTTVTKTDHYHCVVTQEEIHHQTEAETFVPVCEKQVEDTKCSTGDVTGWLSGFFLGALAVVAFEACLVCAKCITVGFKKGPCQQRSGPYKACADHSQQGNGSVKRPSDTEMKDVSPA